MNFRNQIEPQESSVRQALLAARKLFEHIARRTAFSRAGPECLYALLMIGMMLAVPANALDPQKSISQFTHTSWTAKDGIPGPVLAIAQTPDGYLWLGTGAGLYRFDGLRFVAWEPNFGEHIPGSSVWSLCTSRDGSLWVGFSSGGIGRLRDGHLRIYSQTDGVSTSGILSIVEDGDGAIWAGGPYGLSKLESGKWHNVGGGLGYPAPGAQVLFADRRGNLWVATDGFDFGSGKDPVLRNTILVLTPRAKTFVATRESVGQVWAMAEAPDGNVWITDTNGHTTRPITGLRTSERSIKLGAEPQFVLFDRDRSLWTGADQNGLRRMADFRQAGIGLVGQFRAREGLSSDAVYTALEDREGNLWFGTALGLDRFRENKVTPYSNQEGLTADQKLALTSTPDGSVWLVSNAGDTVQRLRRGQTSVSKLPRYSRSDTTRILSLYADPTNGVWVGGSFGLAEESDGKFSFMRVNNIEKGGMVHAIARDTGGNLWITVWGGDKGGGILRLQNGSWTDFRGKVRLPQYRCRILFGDPQGRVWLGFENGEIAVHENDDFHVYSRADGVPGGRVLAISSDRAGNIWIGSESGLSRFDRGRFLTLSKKNGLPGNSVSGIVEDDEGFLWLAGELGVLRVKPQELEKALLSPSYRIQGMSFEASDGFRGLPRQREPFPTATRASDGRIWFSTSEGAAVIDPLHLPKNTIPPPITIEAVVADDRGLTPAPGLRLPPRTRSLQFDFAALSLTAPERVKFRYKLEGYDEDWRGPIAGRQVSYTNLPPRQYQFRVIACNNDGVWNDAGASLAFTLLPAFYQTNWFLLVCVAATGLLAWSTYQWRIRQVAARLDLNFKERLSERTRIARELHDTLLQSFQGLLLHLQRGRNLLPERTAEAMETLDRALDGTEQAIVEGRDAIHDLRSFAPAPKSLAEEITSLGEELISKDGNSDPAQFLVVIEGLAQTLCPQYHVEIFRIAREALRNAVGHAQARRIETEIAYSKKLFRLRIRDDGKGINLRVPDRGEHAGHWGLTGMRERAERIGGQLDVWSEPGAGTEVELRIAGSIVYESSPVRANLQRFGKKKESDYERPA